MDDLDKTRDELIAELAGLRHRIAHLETSQGRQDTTETALRASEDRFRAVVQTIPHGIEECDAEGRITFANAALHRMNGFAIGELIGKEIWYLADTEDAKKKVRQALADLVEQQPPPTPFFGVNRRKDGTTFDVQVDWDYRRKADGTLAGFIAVVTDVTRSKQAEDSLRRSHEELERRVNERTRALARANEKLTEEIAERERARKSARKSEKLYHRIFNAAADGLLVVDQYGKIGEANQAACDIYGYRPQELIGREVAELVQPQDRHLFTRVYERIISGDNAKVEAVNLHKDGTKFYVELSASVFEFHSSIQILCVVRDLTDRKRAEEALDHSEQRFRLAFEEGPLGMAIRNRDGQIVKANRALCQMLGYSSQELEGRCTAELTHPDDRYLNEWVIQQLRDKESPRLSVEKRYLRKNQDVIWGRVTASNLPERPGDTGHTLAMIEDITEHKAAQKVIEEEQLHLRRLLEMHERERQIVAYEIHDGFIQSLVGARMLLDMPRQHLHPDMLERFEKAVGLIGRGIDEARRLISGQRPLILDERGLMAAIEHLVCERQIVDGPEIDYQDLVSFDRLVAPLETAVFRVVQEGLRNAECHSESPNIRLRVTQINGRLRVEIEDWGVGFDPANIGQGCFGLEGLRERARIFGGTAEIKTALGKGTTVIVEFPIVERPPQDVCD